MKLKLFALMALMLTGMVGFFSSSCDAPPAGPAPTSTPTVCVPSAKTYETFEAAPPWDSLPNFMVASEAGYGSGAISAFTWSAASPHGGAYSLQATSTFNANDNYAFLDFESTFGGGSGNPVDVRMCGSAPASLSVWVYSDTAERFYFGVKDGTTTILLSWPPVPASPIATSTWTNVVVPLNGTLWAAGGTFASMDWSHITVVMAAPVELTNTGLPYSVVFKVDDVQFLP